MNLDTILERYRAEVERTMREIFIGRQLGFYAPMRYHLGWEDAEGRPIQAGSGKGLRSTLCLLACEASGGAVEAALPVAAALDLLHNFSLIHDDIQDGDRERRGRATVWTIWGVPQGINVGDGMIAISYLSLLRLSHHVPAETVTRAAQAFAAAQLKICEGQYLDISFEDRLDVGAEAYLEMIALKTAALIACATEIGGIVAGAEDVTPLRRFGHNLGLAFQITDDVLGIWGDPRQTGKPAANDIRRCKKSYPIVYALERATGPAAARLRAIYRDKQTAQDERAVAEVMAILAELRAREQTEQLADQYHQRALAELEHLPESPARTMLITLTHGLSRRAY